MKHFVTNWGALAILKMKKRKHISDDAEAGLQLCLDRFTFK